MRTFTDSPAVRSAVPLLIGLSGPSGSGKTFSALRLATGIQRVMGGEIFGIDTEAGRMKALADYFKFRHVPFGAPFGPLDYLAAVEHCVKRGAKIIVIDSMSHEHEGPGGVLEQHEAETQRLLGAWKNATRDSVNFAAWAGPKAARRRLLNSLLQFECSFIFCFRSKDAMQPVKGGKPEKLGWVPIAGPEFLYEQTINFLLPQASDGTPTWIRESAVQDLRLKPPPAFFRHLFSEEEERQLDEATGEAMAKWSSGGATAVSAASSSPTARPMAASKSAVLPASSAGPVASEAAKGMLSAQLTANGVKLPKDQREWVAAIIGRTPTPADPMTEDECAKCIERAESQAA